MGQGGWTGTDPSGSGNGIVKDYFANSNSMHQPFGRQQAFIGFFPLTDTNGTLNVWRPVNFDPVSAALPIVTFSVTCPSTIPSTSPTVIVFAGSIYKHEQRRRTSLHARFR